MQAVGWKRAALMLHKGECHCGGTESGNLARNFVMAELSQHDVIPSDAASPSRHHDRILILIHVIITAFVASVTTVLSSAPQV